MKLITAASLLAIATQQTQSATVRFESIGLDVSIPEGTQPNGEMLTNLGLSLMELVAEDYHGARVQSVIEHAHWTTGPVDPLKPSVAGIYTYTHDPSVNNRHSVTIFEQKTIDSQKLKDVIRHESIHAEQTMQNEALTFAQTCTACESTYPAIASTTNPCSALDTLGGYLSSQGYFPERNLPFGLFQPAMAARPAVHTAPYFPATGEERAFFISLMQLGIDRAFTALERTRKGMITEQEMQFLADLTKDYQPEAHLLPIHLPSYPELQHREYVLSQLSQSKPITIQVEINQPGSIFRNTYQTPEDTVTIPAILHSIEYINEEIAMAQFQHSENSLSAFLFDIVHSDNAASANQRHDPHRHTLEVHAHLIENLNEKQLRSFFPEMLAYEQEKFAAAKEAEAVAQRCFRI